MLAYLNHTKLVKDGDVYKLNLRCPILKEIFEKKCLEKGIKVEITLIHTPSYHKTKQEYLNHILLTNPNFKEFSEGLGLKLT